MPLDRTSNPVQPAGLKILRVDASGRRGGSVSRTLATELIARLAADSGRVEIIARDLADTAPGFVTEAWIEATFASPDERDASQQAVLRESDELVDELMAADLLVIATPVYNFGIPAALKAWIDMVCRAQLTFRYTEDGPEGLLQGKHAVVVVASGGTEVGSNADFAATYLRHVLGFIGITDVAVIAADRLLFRGDEAVETARQDIARLSRTAPGEEEAA